MMLPQLEDGSHGAEVAGMFFFDDNNYILRRGDPMGERLARVAREQNIMLMMCDQCALERGLAKGEPRNCTTVDTEGYSGGDARHVANFRLAARLRERRPASRKDWVTILSPTETGRACIIPPDSPKTRSSTCAH